MFRSSRHIGPLVVAAACWGLGAVASKRAVAEITPLFLLVIQLIASTVALAAIAVVTRGAMLPDRNRWRLGMLGVLNPGLAYLLSLAGLATITAGISVLLWSLEPLLIIGLAWLFLRERIHPSAVMLSVVAVIGAGLAGAAGLDAAGPGGVALTVAGVGCCAVYTVVTSKQLGDTATLPVVLVQQVFALGFALASTLVQAAVGEAPALESVSRTAWMAAVTSGVLYYGLAFWAFLSGLRCARASTAAVFLSLIPLFGITGGWLLLGERMTPLQIAGASLAVLSVGSLSYRSAAIEVST